VYNRDLDAVRDAYRQAGPTPRLCLQFDDKHRESYYSDRERWIRFSTADSIAKAVDDEANLDEVSHNLFLISRPDLDNMKVHVCGPMTLSAHQQLRNRMHEFGQSEVLKLLQTFSRYPLLLQ